MPFFLCEENRKFLDFGCARRFLRQVGFSVRKTFVIRMFWFEILAFVLLRHRSCHYCHFVLSCVRQRRSFCQGTSLTELSQEAPENLALLQLFTGGGYSSLFLLAWHFLLKSSTDWEPIFSRSYLFLFHQQRYFDVTLSLVMGYIGSLGNRTTLAKQASVILRLLSHETGSEQSNM